MTKLYEANNHILIYTGYDNPAKHSHLAAHIIISMGGRMHITADGTEYFCYGVMIPSGTSHLVDCHGNAALVFLYDCTTAVASQIQRTCIIPEACCRKITTAYSDFEQEETSDHYCRFESTVLTQLGFCCAGSRVMDERILAAMRYIRSMFTEVLSCRQVANAVYLSESRFAHLFREQVGMTFAAYLIYQRIMYVYAQILQGKSITEASLEAGFASSAHFSDTNRRLFGMTASTFLRELTFVKVS